MRIAVIGTGYVGLVAGTCFAESGNDVVCLDIDEKKIARLKAGEIRSTSRAWRSSCGATSTTGASSSRPPTRGRGPGQVVFIAVGTPPGEDGSADLRYVLSAARSIAQNMQGYTVIVDKSTVPVGTANKVAEEVRSHTRHEFDVVSNPEFLKEGAAIDDFMKPDRVVIGTSSQRAREVMEELYAPFVRTGKPILHMDPASAELTKYAANAMLATRISFMNEIANICSRVGASVDHVRKGIGTDDRIGSRFLFSGVGYGGSCFPKDVKAVVRTAAEHGYDFRILHAVEDVNERQKKLLYELVHRHFAGKLQGRRFAVWGLAFKPNTDDMREAPSVVVIEALLAAGATVSACDPEAWTRPGGTTWATASSTSRSRSDALKGADGLILITEWNEFRRPDFEAMKRLLKTPVVFDGRNIYSRKTLEGLGFTYYGVGC
jgi:UDPglucose 6-dehydrogenase